MVLRLDEPCLASNLSISVGENSTFSDGNGSYWEGGYSSDWEKLAEVGLLLETGPGGRGLLLNATSDFATDLSSAANALVGVEHLEESFPGARGILDCVLVFYVRSPTRVSFVPPAPASQPPTGN